MRAQVRVMAGVLVAVALLASCGSSSKKSSGSSNTPSTAAGSQASSSGSSTTVKPITGGGSGICAEAENFAKALASQTNAQSTDFKAQIQQAKDALNKARSEVPSDLKSDYDQFVNAYNKFVDALAAANYDFTKVDLNKLQDFGKQIEGPAKRISEYFDKKCGVTPPSS